MAQNQLLKNMKSPPKGLGSLIGSIAGLAGIGFTINESLFNVEGGYRAVVFNKFTGVKEFVYEEGTHIRIPFVETPYIYDVRTRPRNISSLTGSRDLQMVNITLRVLSKPFTSKLPEIFQRLGTDWDDRVLPSIVNEVLKSVVAQFNASQLITQREQVSRLIRRNLVERAKEFNILLDDVSITHLAFSREYSAAIEAKQIAQQEAERAKYWVNKAEQERNSIIVRAQGEAEAAFMIGDAVKENPAFIELRKVEASREIAKTLSRSGNRIFLNSDQLMLGTINSETPDIPQKKYKEGSKPTLKKIQDLANEALEKKGDDITSEER